MSGSEDSMSRILALGKSFRYPSVYFEMCRGVAPIHVQRMTRETPFAGQFVSLCADGSYIEIVLVNLRKPSMRSAGMVDQSFTEFRLCFRSNRSSVRFRLTMGNRM